MYGTGQVRYRQSAVPAKYLQLAIKIHKRRYAIRVFAHVHVFG